MPEKPMAERVRAADRQEPVYDGPYLVFAIREYLTLQLELRRPRLRAMPLVESWLRQVVTSPVISSPRGKATKAAARYALQSWLWEGLNFGESRLQCEAETDLALDHLYASVGLPPLVQPEDT